MPTKKPKVGAYIEPERGREFVQVETAKPHPSAWRGGAVDFSWTKSLVCPSRV